MSLDRYTLRAVVDLLSPHCGSPDKRRALFTLALGLNHPLLKQLSFEGETDVFIINAIEPLLKGDAEPSKTALWAVLEVVIGRVGESEQRRIRALEGKLHGSAERKSATEQKLHGLLGQLQKAEERGATSLVLDIGEQILQLDALNETAIQAVWSAYFSEIMPIYTGIITHLFEIEIDPAHDSNHLIKVCNRAIELDPLQKIFYFVRGFVYFGKNEYRQAIENFTRSIELKFDVYSLYLRGRSYQNIDNHEFAVADFTKIINDPSFTVTDGVISSERLKKMGYVYFWRAKSNYEKGKSKDAKRDFQTAADLGHRGAAEMVRLIKF